MRDTVEDSDFNANAPKEGLMSTELQILTSLCDATPQRPVFAFSVIRRARPQARKFDDVIVPGSRAVMNLLQQVTGPQRCEYGSPSSDRHDACIAA
jgi:hypothetical protein